MKHSAKRLLSMVLGLGMMVAAFIIFVSFTHPAYTEIQQIRNEKYSFDLELENKKQAIEDVVALIEEHKDDTSFGETVSMIFPTSTELSSALAQIHGLADYNKLILSSINISESGSNTSRSSGGVGAGESSLEKPISVLSFDLDLAGSYGNFKNFLEMIGKNIRLFDIESINLSPAASGSKIPIDFYSYQVKITTYYQNQE